LVIAASSARNLNEVSGGGNNIMVIFKFLLAYTIVTTWTSTEMVDFTRIYALGSLLLAVFCSTEQSVAVNHSLTAAATETTSCKSLGLLLT